MWNQYDELGGGDSALAIVCYASEDILDDIVNAGKTLNESFHRIVDNLKHEIDTDTAFIEQLQDAIDTFPAEAWDYFDYSITDDEFELKWLNESA